MIYEAKLIQDALDPNVPREVVVEEALRVIKTIQPGGLLQNLLIASIALSIVAESRSRMSTVNSEEIWE